MLRFPRDLDSVSVCVREEHGVDEEKESEGRGAVREGVGLAWAGLLGWLGLSLFFLTNPFSFSNFQFSKVESKTSPNFSKKFTKILFEKHIQIPAP